MKKQGNGKDYRKALEEIKSLAPDITKFEVRKIAFSNNLTDSQEEKLFEMANILREDIYQNKIER